MTAPQAAYAYAPANPIAGPAKVFGVIYAVLAALALLFVIGLALMVGLLTHKGAANGMGVVMSHVILVSIIAFSAAALNAYAAYGLLAPKPWGRTLLIVVSILSLLSIPVGTVLGGVALYFFLRDGAKQDYERLVLETL